MAAQTRLSHTALLAALVVLCGPALRGGQPPKAKRLVDLQPGIAVVESRDGRSIRLRLDPNSAVYPAQLQGQTLVIRRLVHKVYLPQSWKTVAQHWQEVGTATVLPIHRTGGALTADLVWEDQRSPVKAGDRAEQCRVPAEAAKPAIVSLRCVGLDGQPREQPQAAPGEVLWLTAEILTATGRRPVCEWQTDAGEYVHAGGAAAGASVTGESMVRWRAPADGKAGKATIKVLIPGHTPNDAVEQSLTIAIPTAEGPYRPSSSMPTRVPGVRRSSLGPLFREASLIAQAPMSSFFLVDAPEQRLLHWGQGPPRYVALGDEPVKTLAAHGDEAWLLRGSSLLRWKPGAKEMETVGSVPEVKRLTGLAMNATGDAFLLDTGAPPRLHVLPRGAAATWQAAPLEPPVDSPWLTAFCVDPLSNDAYILDTRDRMVRRWQALHGVSYRLLAEPIAVGKAFGRFGAPLAVLGAARGGPELGPPMRLVFPSGAVTHNWSLEGEPATWQPTVAAAPGELGLAGFAARCAATATDGDILLGGELKAGRDKRPVVAQVSANGELRRLLPLPEQPPRLLAVAPNGLRFALFAPSRRRAGSEHLVVLGPEGWIQRDLGILEVCEEVVRVRADRASSRYLLLVGERQRRESAVRVDTSDVTRSIELSAAGLPGRKRIPDHEAVDAASSPHHIVVLDRSGKVIVLANERPLKYVGHFETKLRRPKAIAILDNIKRPQAADEEGRTYVCVLPSGRDAKGVHLWELRTPGGEEAVADPLGPFPDPERTPAEVHLSSPVTIDTGFPDRPERLYVLDRGGTQVRMFDVAEIAFQLRRRLPPQLAATPILGDLPFEDEEVDMAVGPGQVLYFADPEHEALHTYARGR